MPATIVRSEPPASGCRAPLVVAAVAIMAISVAPTAQAAERLVGVLGGDRLVLVRSDTVPGLSRPATLRGLPPGERVRALDRTPDGRLLGLGSSSAIYTIDLKAMTAKLRLAAVGAPVPEGAVTFAVAADGTTARLIAGGRDLTIDLRSGTTTQNAAQAPPVAADYLPDGRLVGVDAENSRIVVANPFGFASLAPLGTRLTDATRVSTAADGTQWIISGLRSDHRAPRHRQSMLLHYTPSTGKVTGASGPFLFSVLHAVAALGHLADDHTPPKVAIRVPRQTLGRALRNHGFDVRVDSSEPGETTISARVGGTRAYGFGYAEYARPYTVVTRTNARTLRRAVGKRVRLHIAVHDFAHNVRTFDRTVRVSHD